MTGIPEQLLQRGAGSVPDDGAPARGASQGGLPYDEGSASREALPCRAV